MRCPQCGHENAVETKFCGECGTPLTVMCRECGARNAPAQKFCGEVFRRVRIGCRELTRRCTTLEASATLAAELLNGQIAGTALPA